MSSLAAFKNLVSRAQIKADNQISLIENMPITTNVGIILFANKHIDKVEEQLIQSSAESERLRKLILSMLETAADAGIPKCQFDDDFNKLSLSELSGLMATAFRG